MTQVSTKLKIKIHIIYPLSMHISYVGVLTYRSSLQFIANLSQRKCQLAIHITMESGLTNLHNQS